MCKNSKKSMIICILEIKSHGNIFTVLIISYKSNYTPYMNFYLYNFEREYPVINTET